VILGAAFCIECSPFYFGLAHDATKHERLNMLGKIEAFFSNDDGAVTVDWVVLTAAVCGLAIASFASIQQGGKTVSDNVSTYLNDTTVEEIAGIDG
jgi:hypothetical protein